MLKVPRPHQDWECPKCANHGANYSLRFYEKFQENEASIRLSCNRCGYTEQRAPMDAEDACKRTHGDPRQGCDMSDGSI